MFAGETKLDDRDLLLHSHIGRWVFVTWRNDLFKPPEGVAYGSHLATFVLCPYGKEIRGLNVCWLYSSCDDGRIFRVGKPLVGIAATWLFQYSTFKKFEAAPLSSQDVEFLGLPDLDAELHADVPEPIRELRCDTRLHPFRHPGFPDDVSATCGPSFEAPGNGIEMRGEQVWIRLAKRYSDCRFAGTLLNQPVSNGWKKGTQVAVNLLEAVSGNVLVCAEDSDC